MVSDIINTNIFKLDNYKLKYAREGQRLNTQYSVLMIYGCLTPKKECVIAVICYVAFDMTPSTDQRVGEGLSPKQGHNFF